MDCRCHVAWKGGRKEERGVGSMMVRATSNRIRPEWTYNIYYRQQRYCMRAARGERITYCFLLFVVGTLFTSEGRGGEVVIMITHDGP